MAVLLKGSVKDLDGFSVTRLLPHMKKRMVGPFIFFDHMGPADFLPGEGIDVRPHPHIGLSTITYMLDGSLLHRDSLGNNLEILPGDVNWMTAGKGIVHSERETLEVQTHRHTLNGIQCWLALPKAMAEIEPSFHHIKRAQLPHFIKEGITKRLIAGEAYGMTSPLKTYSPMFYLDVVAKANKTITRPTPEQECMIYIIDGKLTIGDNQYQTGDAVLLEHEQHMVTDRYSRFLLLGGENWPEVPRMYWNFVSFDMARIEQAKQDWIQGKFPTIPGDNQEFTPLP
ncbi:pirin family protein [Paraferrimonas sp. SM1919]|uniref:pirin family protein n=1 Tax=Paraferrimonas sp. SM1919 TaxID=2662263 RepID=UPI0013CF4D48|nr:pirin family protein [Paraferrimonas sp. SM1919]